MSERRAHRGLPPRTDQQILDHPTNMWILGDIAAGRVTRDGTHLNAQHLLDGKPLLIYMKRLARDDRVWVPIGNDPSIAPRGARILELAWGEIPAPPQE